MTPNLCFGITVPYFRLVDCPQLQRFTENNNEFMNQYFVLTDSMVPSLDHVLRERYLCLYETRRSIAVFVKYRYWTLPFPSELRLLFNIILYMIHCNTIFLPKPRSPKQFIPTEFQTKILDIFFIFLMHTISPEYLVLLS